jgi:hypothetical protein
MTDALTWQPFFPAPAIAVLAAVAAGLAVFAYARSIRRAPWACGALLVARLALIGAIAVVLLGPSRVPPPKRQAGQGDLFVLLDDSASMQATDMDGEARYDFATRQWLGDERIAEWSSRRQVLVQDIDEVAHAASLEQARRPAAEAATAARSRLARSVRAAVEAIPAVREGSAAIVLSDGHDSEEEGFSEAARRARERGLPVYTVCLGGPRLERDVHLVAVTRQDYLFADEEGQVSIRLAQSNAGRDRTILRVTHAGATRSIPVSFEGRSVVTVDLAIRHAKAGTYEYRFAVDPIADEVETRNNQQVLFVPVVARRIRVLLVEGEPHWETKFLAQALRRDDRIELIQVSQLSKTRTETLASRTTNETARLPQTRAELDAFDVVILGRRVEGVLPAPLLAYLPEYVDRRGGSVLFARGRATAEARPLALLEPVVWPAGDDFVENGVWTPTGAGAMHPAFRSDQDRFGRALAELPPFPRTEVTQAKSAALVLAVLQGGASGAARPVPALVAMNVGRGKSMAVLSEGVWTWRLLSPRRADWRDLYDRFWSNTVRWLALGGDFVPGEEVALHVSHQSAALGEAVTIDAHARYVDAARVRFRLSVRDPDGRVQQPALEPVEGDLLHQRARYVPTVPGVHTVSLEAPGLAPARRETGLNVFALDQERLQSAAMPEALRRLAEESGGKPLDPRRPGAFCAELDRVTAAAVVPARPVYVWNTAGLLVLLLSWAGAEWILRRFGGLL